MHQNKFTSFSGSSGTVLVRFQRSEFESSFKSSVSLFLLFSEQLHEKIHFLISLEIFKLITAINMNSFYFISV